MLETVPLERPPLLARRRFATVAGFAITTMAAVAIGNQVWSRGATPVLAAVRFEMRLAEDQPVHGTIAARIAGSDRLVHLHPEIVVNNDDIADAVVLQDGPAGFGVAVRLLAPGAARMRQATATHLGRPVAILIDGVVVTAPVVRSPIDEAAVISGHYTQADAERIARGIGGQ